MRFAFAAGFTLALALSTGCATTESPADFSSRVVSGDADAVFAAGRALLAEEFQRLDTTDVRNRRAVTAPEEFNTRRDSGTARDLYGNRSRMRRYATLSVSERGTETVARFRVDVERLDTSRGAQQARVQRPNMRFSDYPGDETAVERDAATNIEQNTTWTKVRRDRELENDLLARLTRRLEDGGPPGTRSTNIRPASLRTRDERGGAPPERRAPLRSAPSRPAPSPIEDSSPNTIDRIDADATPAAGAPVDMQSSNP